MELFESPCRTCEWFSAFWMSRVTHMNECVLVVMSHTWVRGYCSSLVHTCDIVHSHITECMSHMWMSGCLSSCHTCECVGASLRCEWVMWPIRMRKHQRMCFRYVPATEWRSRRRDDFQIDACVAVSCRVLQCVVVCCSDLEWRSRDEMTSTCMCVLQCVAVCCSVLQCVAVCWCHLNVCVAVCCCGLQCVRVCCSVLLCVAATLYEWAETRWLLLACVCCSVLRCSELQCVAVCWCHLDVCVAVCCSVLQRVAVCCSVLQCVAATLNEGAETRWLSCYLVSTHSQEMFSKPYFSAKEPSVFAKEPHLSILIDVAFITS